jgi:flagellar biosynthesis/type III secretory pathway protein FliH
MNDRTIPETVDLGEIHSMLEERRLDWWEQWKLEGIQEGRREGVLEGRREGKLQGILEGKREGILEGEARLLQLILSQRFKSLPAWADERLTQATEADLVRWAKNVLAPTLSLEEILTA